MTLHQHECNLRPIMKDAKEHASTDCGEKQAICTTPTPYVERITLGNGRVILHGVTAAAKWMGVTPASLSALARGVNGIPITWEARARAEFPGLFPPAN